MDAPNPITTDELFGLLDRLGTIIVPDEGAADLDPEPPDDHPEPFDSIPGFEVDDFFEEHTR